MTWGKNFLQVRMENHQSCKLIFQANMLKGDVRGAVKYLAHTEKGGVLLPDDIDKKFTLTIKEVLQSKYPRETPTLPYYLYP
jgi:hypothetical protein